MQTRGLMQEVVGWVSCAVIIWAVFTLATTRAPEPVSPHLGVPAEWMIHDPSAAYLYEYRRRKADSLYPNDPVKQREYLEFLEFMKRRPMP